MDKKVNSKEWMFYTIAGVTIIVGYLLNIFSIQIAEKILIKQQQVATLGTTLLGVGSLLGVIEIKKNRDI